MFPKKVLLTFFFFASCLSSHADDFQQVENLFRKIESRNVTNQSKIYSWAGEATITKPYSKFHIKFANDKLHDIEYFMSRDFVVGGEKFGNWKRAQLRHGTRHHHLEIDGVLHIRNHGTNKGLNEVSFDPFITFRVMNTDVSSLFDRFRSYKDQDWFRIRVTQEGDNLIHVFFGNNKIDIPDSELVFDLNQGGNLIESTIPGPGTSSAYFIKYKEFDGVWLPVEFNRKVWGDKEDWSSLVFTSQEVNKIRPLTNFNLIELLDLPEKTKIVDHTSQTTFETFSDIPTTAGETQPTSWSHGFRITSILLLFAAASTLIIFQFDKLTSIAKSKKWSLKSGAFLILLTLPLSALFLNSGAMTSTTAGNEDDQQAVNQRCGHWCVLRSARMMGCDISLKDIGDVIPTRTSGNSMLELQQALKSFGIQSEGQRVSALSLLTSNQLPCIAKLDNPDHYIILFESEDGRICSLDGSRTRRGLFVDVVDSRWSGNILTMSKSDKSDQRKLSFDSLIQDLGIIPAQASVSRTFQFRNHSQREIKIADVHISCDCLSTEFPKEPIGPGESSKILLSFNPSKKAQREGNFSHSAIVEFQGDETAYTELQISGQIARPFHTPLDVVNFGSIDSGTVTSVTVPIVFNQLDSMSKLPKLNIESKYFTAIWEQDQTIEQLHMVPLKVSVNIPDNMPRGELADVMKILGESEKDTLKLPLRASIVGGISAYPNVVHYSQQKPSVVELVSENKFQLQPESFAPGILVDAKETSEYQTTRWRLELNLPQSVLETGTLDIPVESPQGKTTIQVKVIQG